MAAIKKLLDPLTALDYIRLVLLISEHFNYIRTNQSLVFGQNLPVSGRARPCVACDGCGSSLGDLWNATSEIDALEKREFQFSESENECQVSPFDIKIVRTWRHPSLARRTASDIRSF